MKLRAPLPTLTDLRGRLTPRLLALQLGGNALLAALFLAALRIPDSHIWQFAASIVVIASLAAAFLALHAFTVRSVREPGGAVTRLWQGGLILAAWLLLWHILAHLIGLVFEDILVTQRAGYLNSRLPPHLRNTFTYERLSDWQTGFAHLLLWWVLPTLLLPLLIETTARALRTLRERETWRVLKRWPLWLSTAVAVWLTSWSNAKLLAWRPGRSVHGELLSVVFRLVTAYALDILAVCALLAFIAALLAREHTRGDAVPQPPTNSPHPIPVD